MPTIRRSADPVVRRVTGQTDGGRLALTEHFNGTSWSIMPALDPGQLGNIPDSTLSSVASPAAGIVWAVGAQRSPGSAAPGRLPT